VPPTSTFWAKLSIRGVEICIMTKNIEIMAFNNGYIKKSRVLFPIPSSKFKQSQPAWLLRSLDRGLQGGCTKSVPFFIEVVILLIVRQIPNSYLIEIF